MIRACNNRIIMRQYKSEIKSASGLIVPNQDTPQFEVIHVGPGKYDQYQDLIPMPVVKGDIVWVDPYGLKEIKFGSETLWAAKSDDVIGIIERKD